MAGFDQQSQRRISEAVREIERRMRSRQAPGRKFRHYPPVSGHDRCTALLKGALDSGDASTTVDNVAPIKGTDPVGGVAATEITAYNVHEWDGDDNAKCRMEWNRTTEHWELYQVTCPA